MTRASRIGLLVLALLLLSVASIPRVHASPLFELTGDTLGTGGLSARIRASGAAATYFNPALLTDTKQGLEISEFVLYDWIRTTYDARPSGKGNADIPISAVERFGSALPGIPTDWLQHGCSHDTGTCSTNYPASPRGHDTSSGNTHAYQGIGLVNHIWPGVVTAGFYALVPIGPFTTGHAFFVDEREQYFSNSLHPELFSDRLTAISLAGGLGIRLHKTLSIGFNATLALKNNANATTFTGDADNIHDSIQVSTKLKVLNSVSPHGGLVYKPIDRLKLSLTVHSPQKTEINTKFANILPTGDYQSAYRRSTLDYVPWTVGLGALGRVYQAGMHALDVSGQVTYERWSRYINRQNEHPHGKYAWDDIFAYTVGLSHTYNEKLTSFIDAQYRKSPVPAQTGRTNYVDNDRIGSDLGVQYNVPLPQYRIALRFGAQAQLHYLLDRHQTKLPPSNNSSDQRVRDEWPDNTIDRTSDPAHPKTIAEAKGLQTNNPGWPGFGSDGVIVGGGINAAILY